MSDDNKVYKSAILNFEASAYQSNTPNTNIVFSTQDTGGTAQLVFNLKKENGTLPLSTGATPKLIMIMSDSSRYIVNPVVSDRLKGQSTYSLTDEQLTHSGIVKCELYVTYPDQGMQIHQFEFTIDKALIDSNMIATVTYYVQTWNDWEAYFQSEMDDLQAELDNLQKQADSQQEQFDNLNPAQFAQKTALDEHVNDADIHVTVTDKTNWNGKETPAGAQTKADQALADAKADAATLYEPKITKTPWTAPVLSSGFSILDARFPPMYRRDSLGNVTLRGAINRTSATGMMYTLPEGFRPTSRRGFSVALVSSTSGTVATVYVQDDGKVELVAASQNSPVWVEITFSTD
ncbi:phage baseplate upper protein [Listeria monocytogenes]|nr:phage baseplate upper protein [Listeria monocytogenes]